MLMPATRGLGLSGEKENLMPVNVVFSLAIFFLGTAIGALLTRLKWKAFETQVSERLMEQVENAVSSESNRIRIDQPTPIKVDATSEDELRPFAAPCVSEPIRPGILASLGPGEQLEKKLMELDRIRRDIQTLRDAIPLLEDEPNAAEQSAREDFSNIDAELRARYGNWLNPHRVG